MPLRSLLGSEARNRCKALIAELESRTAAELVVSVCRQAGRYRHLDFAVGAVLALVVLVGMLFLPQVFPLWTFVPGVLLGFVGGVGLALLVPPLRRVLSPATLRSDEAARAAKAAFFDLGVARVRARTGVLVHVSLFERQVTVLTDTGIDRAPLEPAIAAVREAVVLGLDPFLAALRRLGDALTAAHPRAAGDANELSDEVGS